MLISQVTVKVAGVAVFRADFLMTNTALRAANVLRLSTFVRFKTRVLPHRRAGISFSH